QSQPERKMGIFALGFQCLLDRWFSHFADVLALRTSFAGAALADRSGDGIAVKADRTARIVIARNRESDPARVAVGIEDRDDGNAKDIGFLDGQLFLVGVDDEHHVGKAAHIANAAKALLELVALTGELKHLLLGEAGGVARKLLLKALQAFDRIGDGFPVGEHSSEPAMVDEMLAAGLSTLGDRILGLPLGADEQHLSATGDRLLHEVERTREQWHGL